MQKRGLPDRPKVNTVSFEAWHVHTLLLIIQMIFTTTFTGVKKRFTVQQTLAPLSYAPPLLPDSSNKSSVWIGCFESEKHLEKTFKWLQVCFMFYVNQLMCED